MAPVKNYDFLLGKSFTALCLIHAPDKESCDVCTELKCFQSFYWDCQILISALGVHWMRKWSGCYFFALVHALFVSWCSNGMVNIMMLTNQKHI